MQFPKEETPHRRYSTNLSSQQTRGTCRPFYRAIVYVGLNRKDQAFEWLEQAYQEHDLNLIGLAIDPTHDSLRADPRFTRLLQLTGLIPHVTQLTPRTLAVGTTFLK